MVLRRSWGGGDFSCERGTPVPAESLYPTSSHNPDKVRDFLVLHSHLTECMNQIVSESQLPHKIVNLLFTNSTSKQQLNDFGGQFHVSNRLINTFCKINSTTWPAPSRQHASRPVPRRPVRVSRVVPLQGLGFQGSGFKVQD